MARPALFAWDSTRTSGMDYNANKIKASEWIRLQQNIYDVGDYLTSTPYVFSATPATGDIFTSTFWNDAINGISELSLYYTQPLPSVVSTGNRLMASYIEAIKDCINSADDIAITIMSFNTDQDLGWSGASPSKTIWLPLISLGTYNFIVDWGDGNSDTITVYNQAERNHTYASIGTYTVTLTGTIIGWNFEGAGDCRKLLDIQEWGASFKLYDVALGRYFENCWNLDITATNSLDLTGNTNMRACFLENRTLASSGSINNMDVSSIEDFGNMFTYCDVFNSDITGWNTSSALDMGGMFLECFVFNQDISGWNVSNVTDMALMFNGANAFNQNITAWDTSSVLDMSGMFSYNSGFDSYLLTLDTSSVTDMHSMFRNATTFDQDISFWNVSNVTDMSNMFNGATMYNQSMSAWNITSVTDMTDMLKGCTLGLYNYDTLLVSWGGQAVQYGVVFSAGNSKYSGGGSPADLARTHLIDVHGWTITDGGTV